MYGALNLPNAEAIPTEPEKLIKAVRDRKKESEIFGTTELFCSNEDILGLEAALRKSIPMRPRPRKSKYPYDCTACFHEVKYGQAYCSVCGQMINWDVKR